MGAENGDAAVRDVADFFDKNGTLAAQGFDNPFVVNNFMADIDRRAIDLQRALDNFDGTLDAGAKATRPYQQYVQRKHFGIFGQMYYPIFGDP